MEIFKQEATKEEVKCVIVGDAFVGKTAMCES